jgi:hypothetical protein
VPRRDARRQAADRTTPLSVASSISFTRLIGLSESRDLDDAFFWNSTISTELFEEVRVALAPECLTGTQSNVRHHVRYGSVDFVERHMLARSEACGADVLVSKRHALHLRRSPTGSAPAAPPFSSAAGTCRGTRRLTRGPTASRTAAFVSTPAASASRGRCHQRWRRAPPCDEPAQRERLKDRSPNGSVAAPVGPPCDGLLGMTIALRPTLRRVTRVSSSSIRHE